MAVNPRGAAGLSIRWGAILSHLDLPKACRLSRDKALSRPQNPPEVTGSHDTSAIYLLYPIHGYLKLMKTRQPALNRGTEGIGNDERVFYQN